MTDLARERLAADLRDADAGKQYAWLVRTDDLRVVLSAAERTAKLEEALRQLEDTVLDVVALLDVVGEETPIDIDSPAMDYFCTVSKNIGFLRIFIAEHRGDTYYNERYAAYTAEHAARRALAGET